ncbi:hypothetical protein PCK2_001045, partial [Pneumocystis canis]
YKATGSIFDFLKNKEWVTEVNIEYVVADIDYFRIGVSLTPEGLDNYENIITLIFEYLNMLKKLDPEEWIYKELIAINKLGFRFADLPDPSDYVSSLSSLMQESYIDYKDILTSSIPTVFNKDYITDVLSFLRPDNCFFFIASQTHPGTWDKKEKWYGSQYTLTYISDNLKQQLSTLTDNLSLKLPTQNPFIPKNFIIKPPKDNASIFKVYQPELIYNDSMFNIWYKGDDTFSSPRTHVMFLIKSFKPFLTLISPLYYATSRLTTTTQLYIKLILDSLKDVEYYAAIAGNYISLSPNKLGIQLQIDAYTDNIYTLFQAFIDVILTYSPSITEFLHHRDQLLSIYKNSDMGIPFKRLSVDASYLYNEKFWPTKNLYFSLQTLTYTDITTFLVSQFSRTSIDALIVGSASSVRNMHNRNFSDYIRLLTEKFNAIPLYPYQHLYSRTQLLDEGSNYIYELDVINPDEENSAILYSLQLSHSRDWKLLALLYLLRHIAHNPAFQQLRTKEQLGYLVKTSAVQTGNMLSFQIMVQSLRDPFYLELRINAFLYKLTAIIETLTEEQFKTHVQTFITAFSSNFETLDDEVNQYWTCITSGLLNFNKETMLINAFKELEKRDLVDMFYKYIYPGSLSRKKLSIHLKSQTLEKVSSRDLSASRLHAFLVCEGIGIPYDKLVSFLESNNKLSDLEKNLIKYLSQKYPSANVLSIIKNIGK